MSSKGEFAHGKVDPAEAGAKGGHGSGGSDNTDSSTGSSGNSGNTGDNYKPTEHDGLKQDGTPDKRVGTGEFAHGKVDPSEAASKSN